MRPSEIDYTSTKRHFFDLATGEVLAGQQEHREYVARGHDSDNVRPLGEVLRGDQSLLNIEQYEPFNAREWDLGDFKDYGRWLIRATRACPANNEPDLSRGIINQARRMGLGPNLAMIRRRFGSMGLFYADIDALNTKRNNNFDRWELEDYVRYLQQIGHEEGRRPKLADIEQRAAKSTRRPNRNHIYDRFKHIGGTRKLLELAGFVVHELWDDPDYVDWGVSFMQVNDGLLPGDRPIQFLSAKDLGPSKRPILRRFGSLTEYQSNVAKSYWKTKHEEDNARDMKFREIFDALRSGRAPVGLFIYEDDDQSIAKRRALRAQLWGNTSNDPSILLDLLAENEIFKRYGKYQVVQSLIPDSFQDRKITIAVYGLEERGFVSSIRKINPGITSGQIEAAALLADVFDDIWPTDGYMEKLKLGDEYEAYCDELRAKRKQRARTKNKIAA